MSDTKFTSGPWQWWTSCSWRRLKNTDGADVLTPFVNRADGHPDCAVSDADAALIAASWDMYEEIKYHLEMTRLIPNGEQTADFKRMDALLKKARGE